MSASRLRSPEEGSGRHGAAHGRRHIAGGRWRPLPALTRQIATAAGGRAPRQVPAAIAMAGAAASELTARLLRRDPAATRAGTRVLLEGNTQHLDSQRAERELGVTFRPLQATLTDETAWYRSHGALPIRRDHASSTEQGPAAVPLDRPGDRRAES